ncbi:MAG: peptidoglycan binding domain-containing protein [Firmicutes bacterium]|nr:peptidoglycan binding domain-containing protein [Bacillota bacterium]
MKKLWWIIPVILLLGAVGYFYYTGYQRSLNEYLQGTYINGMDVSGMKPADVDAILNKPGRTFTVTEMNAETREPMEETMDLKALGYTQLFDTQGILDRQPHWDWFVSYWKQNRQEIAYTGFTIDENKVASAIASLYCMQPENNIAPVDAELKAEDGHYFVTESDDGCQIDTDAAARLVQEAVMAEKVTIDLTAEDLGLYSEAAVKTDDAGLAKQIEDLNKVWEKTITVEMYGSVKEVIDEEMLRKLLIPKEFDVYINETELTAYVEELFDQYSTWQREREFKTSTGKTVKIGTENDIFGYDMNKEETKAAIHDALLSKKDETCEAVWDYEGYWDDEMGNDIGRTYVEISIEDQHLWYYVDGELKMETDVVTGNRGVTDTPKGVFVIWAKRTKVTLIGEDYQTPVELWLPITWDGIGIHDASWRSTFGGSLYDGGGSHGCINTPYSFCQPFFDTVELETPVVIY